MIWRKAPSSAFALIHEDGLADAGRMKRWLVTLVLLIFISAVASMILVLVINPWRVRRKHEAEVSYTVTWCYDMNHDVPPPPDPHLGSDGSFSFTCSVPGA